MRLRRSLLVRLLAVSVLVAACSIAATTWLVMSSTTAAIRQEQGQSLTDDARIYDTLVAYAARHRDWRGAGPSVQALARRTGRRIVLTTKRRAPISASTPRSAAPLPRQATATVDPLAVDPALGADRIDRRALGPFRHRATATAPATRSRVAAPAPAPAEAAPTAIAPQRRALARLQELTERCLKRRHHRADPRLGLDAAGLPTSAAAARDRVVAACFRDARREQLRPWVAPAALLFVTGPRGAAATSLDLSSRHRLRIAGVALIILTLTITATALAARRLVRPLREVTRAAERMTEGDGAVRVQVAGRDELSRLAESFNALAERREQLERQRTAMVSDVAHELRTPVSNIRGWLEAAQDGVATPDPAFVASLLEEATLLHHIIDDLQDLSAAEAGELRVHPERLEVVDVLEQVAGAHRLTAGRAGVTLAVAGDRSLELDADPLRLRQAIGNLISNAVRHSPAGTTVTLRARGEGEDVAIEVADEGEGIRGDHLAHVFDRFWRAEKSRSRRAGGSGLGLPIVRRLVEAHGGTVTVASAPGAGATFTLRLPGRQTSPS